MRHGFLLIDKPAGPTSHDIVQKIRRALPESKVGHLGTLDPAATGLLVLAVGPKALKIIEFFNELPKEYEADITLGAVSSTFDRDGVIEQFERKPGCNDPDHLTIRRLIEDRFLGSQEQEPPMHSAIHIDGQRAYSLARQGKKVAMPKRSIEISSCDILSYDYPLLRLRIGCSSGTYIRSLANDLGAMLRCGGYLSGLRRTKVGDWNITDAADPDKADWAHVIPLRDILAPFHKIELTAEEADSVRMGKKIPRELKPDTVAWHEDLPIAIMVPSKDGSRTAHARKVL